MTINQFNLSAYEKFSEEGLPENFGSLLAPDSGYSETIDFETSKAMSTRK